MTDGENPGGSRKTTDIDRFVGARIKSARLSLGWSQTELADHLGITFQQVQKYEKGTNRVSAATIFSVAQLFKLPLTYFFEEPDSPSGDIKLGSRATAVTSRLEVRLLNTFRMTPSKLRTRLVALLEAVAEVEGENGSE